MSGALDLHGQNWTAELKYISGGKLEVDFITLTSTAKVEDSSWSAIKSLFRSEEE